MPTVPGIPGPYRFFFFSTDCDEPPHVHVRREAWDCKFWLQPVALARRGRFPAHEIAGIEKTIFQYLPLLLEAWDEHCGS
jgi:uncharacterized protein DUF4160